MKMFHWANTEFNGNYTGGDLLVLAETVGEAREKARREIKKSLKESYSYDQKRYKEKLAEFEEDIAKNPKEKSVVSIYGSA